MAKQTKLRKQQLQRIKAIITRAEAKGYTFGSFKDEYKSFSTQKLKSLTAPQVKSLAEYIPNFTDVVLRNVEEMIQEGKDLNIRTGREESSNTTENASYLERTLQDEISEYGRDKVALACEQAPDEIIVLARETIYASSTDRCVRRAREIVDIIRGFIPTIDEAKQDAEFMEEFEDNSVFYQEDED